MMQDTDTAGAVQETPAIAEISDTAEATQEPAQEEAEKSPPKTYTEAEFKQLEKTLKREQRRIDKITADKYQYKALIEQKEAELAKYTQKPASPPEAPDETKFTDYGELKKAERVYQKNLTQHEIQEALAAERRQQQERLSKEQQKAWETERDAHFDSTAEEAGKSFSDFSNVIEENLEAVQSVANHVRTAFREAEHGAHALYILLKEGKLEDLNDMSPTKAAMAIALAEERAVTLAKTKQVTKAPAPMAPSRGTTAGSKSIDAMSGEELLNWVKTR
jgi:hypothetical protein